MDISSLVAGLETILAYLYIFCVYQSLVQQLREVILDYISKKNPSRLVSDTKLFRI